MVNTATDWEARGVIQARPGRAGRRKNLADSHTESDHVGTQAEATAETFRPGPRFPGMDQLEVLLEDPLIALWASEFGRRRYVTRMDALAALAVALDLPEPGGDQIATRVAGRHSPVDHIAW